MIWTLWPCLAIYSTAAKVDMISAGIVLLCFSWSFNHGHMHLEVTRISIMHIIIRSYDQRLVHIHIQAYIGINRTGAILRIKVTVKPVLLLLFPQRGTHDIAPAIATADPPPCLAAVFPAHLDSLNMYIDGQTRVNCN